MRRGSGGMDRFEQKIDELKEAVAKLCGQVGEMIRAEDSRAKETTERRAAQDKIIEKLEDRIRRLERQAAVVGAYGIVATLAGGALFAWLFGLIR